MITFEQGKRIVDTLHRFGVDWDDICDLWDSEVACTSQENGGRAPDAVRQTEDYALMGRALEILEQAEDDLSCATWYDEDTSEGIFTTDGLPEGTFLRILDSPGDEVISLRFKDRFGNVHIHEWFGDTIPRVEKYLPKGWRYTYAALYEFWKRHLHLPYGLPAKKEVHFTTEEQQA